MSNHGVVTYADTLHRAYMKMETVEHFAQIALVTHCLGRQQPLRQQDLKKLLLARSKYEGTHSVAAMPLAALSGFPRAPIKEKRRVPPEPVRQGSKAKNWG
jgi:hypothetical protein